MSSNGHRRSSEYASTFIIKFNKCESKVKKIVKDLTSTATELKEMQEKAQTTAIAGGAVAIAGAVIAVLGVPLTGGLSLLIGGVGAAGAAAGGGTALGGGVHLALVENESVGKVKKYTREFRDCVKELKEPLKSLKRECDINKIRSEPISDIPQLLCFIQNLTISISAGNISAVAEQYESAFNQLVLMKKNLKRAF